MYYRNNSLTDSVNVSLIKSHLASDSSYAKVQRKTAYIGNIVTEVMKTNSILSQETLLFAAGLFRDAVISLIKSGHSVDILELGTLYLKAKSGMDTATPSITDVPEMTVAFTPSDMAVEAVKDVTILADVTGDTNPEMKKFYNVSSHSNDFKFNASNSVRLTGKKLKIAGDEATAGIYIVPCDAKGLYKQDESDWIKVTEDEITDNKPSVLLFNIPSVVSTGTYRIAIKSYYSNGVRTLKSIRQTVFETVFTVE